MTKLDKALLGAAVAGILGAMASGPVHAADKAKAKNPDVECMGVNACKGKSSCAGAKSSCSGMNACKGQGWVKVSKDVCDQLGGTASPMMEKTNS